jgi:hypothetical protein
VEARELDFESVGKLSRMASGVVMPRDDQVSLARSIDRARTTLTRVAHTALSLWRENECERD